MTIEQLSDTRIVITLSEKDMELFSLKYDNISLEDETFQKILRRLIKLSQERLSIPMQNKTLFIEALARLGGCVLLITIHPRSSSAKRYRIKENSTGIMFSFKNSDDLTDCMVQLYKNGFRLLRGEVFSTSNEYSLILNPHNNKSHLALNVLSEYSAHQTESKIKIAAVREHGTPLAAGFPVMKIGSIFAEKQR